MMSGAKNFFIASRSPDAKAFSPSRMTFSFGWATVGSFLKEDRLSARTSRKSNSRRSSLERENSEPLCVLDTDLLAVLFRLHRKPFFEEAEHPALDLAGVVAEC